MRRLVWYLLLVFAFAIPWEFSLDLGAPIGNVARFTGLILIVVAIPAVLQAGSIRGFGTLHWLALVLYLWFCVTSFWTVDQDATLIKLRAWPQDMMVAWFLWEFAETPRDLRRVLNVFLAGCWVLALLTLAGFRSAEAIAEGQYRFTAYGQDPNDVARYLDLGFPIAALLGNTGSRWMERLLALGYLPVALLAVLLTASRGGFMAAAVGLVGCAILLARGYRRAALAAGFSVPIAGALVWLFVPAQTFVRLATIPQQLSSGDLNQRLNIWDAGWKAFTRAPIWGSGVGSFTTAAGLTALDTAHNSALSVAVSGGLIALSLMCAVFAVSLLAAWRLPATLRWSFVPVLLVWSVSSMVGTVEENRTSWLLFGAIALASRFCGEDRGLLTEAFPNPIEVQAQ